MNIDQQCLAVTNPFTSTNPFFIQILGDCAFVQVPKRFVRCLLHKMKLRTVCRLKAFPVGQREYPDIVACVASSVVDSHERTTIIPRRITAKVSERLLRGDLLTVSANYE